MKELTCDICGGPLMGQPGGVFCCTACGMQYDVAWARAKLAQPEQQPQPVVEEPPVQQNQAPAPEAPVYVPPTSAPEPPAPAAPAPAPARPVYIPPAPAAVPTDHHLPPTARVSAVDVSSEAEKAERKRRADADFAIFQQQQQKERIKKTLIAIGVAFVVLVLAIMGMSELMERNQRVTELKNDLDDQIYILSYSDDYSMHNSVMSAYNISTDYKEDYYIGFRFDGSDRCRILVGKVSIYNSQNMIWAGDDDWDVEVKATGEENEFKFIFTRTTATDSKQKITATVTTSGTEIISIEKN